jgi:hypothetical protein
LWKERMREAMNDSGELWKAKLSERPRRVEEVPSGSWGSGFGIVKAAAGWM